MPVTPRARLGCVLAVVAATLVAAAPGSASAGRSAATLRDNSITVTFSPKSPKAGAPVTVVAEITVDKRLHKPPYDYVKAGVWQQRGTAACPRVPPDGKRGWARSVSYEYKPDLDSGHTEVSASVTPGRPGLYRFCGYVYVERPSQSIGVFTSSLHTRASASSILKVR